MTDREPSPAGRRGTRLEVFAWAMYDWANSAYSTLLITIVMSYITRVVLPGDNGAVAYAWVIAGSMLVAAVLSPILGAMADARAAKRKWLAATAICGSVGSVLMAAVPYTYPWVVVAVFFLVCLCFETSLGFYNGFLPEIADEKTMNRVSAWGYALGYVGGGLALVVAIVVVQYGGRLGLPDGDALTGDFHYLTEGQFDVELPEGTYAVTLTLGDALYDHDEIEILIQGNPRERVDVAAGEFIERTYDGIAVDGEPLSVRLVDRGGENPYCVINGLKIVNESDNQTVLAFDFGTAGSVAMKGYIWLDQNHRWQSYRRQGNALVDEVGFAEKITVEETVDADVEKMPERIRCGWSEGTIHSRDAVLPLRLRIGVALMGLWWGVFTIPTIWVLRDRVRPTIEMPSVAKAAAGAVRKVGQTLSNVRHYRMLAFFLIGFLFFNDGIQTVISQAPLFADKELDFGTDKVIMLVLLVQFLALPGAMIVGWLADHLGQKPTLLLCIGVWIGLLIAAWFVTTHNQFWALAVVLSMVMGGTQSVSRAVMGMMTPTAHTAEFFGFFNLSGKATSWLGNFLFGFVMLQTGSARLAILALIVFFIIGGVFVTLVNVTRGREQAGFDVSEDE